MAPLFQKLAGLSLIIFVYVFAEAIGGNAGYKHICPGRLHDWTVHFNGEAVRRTRRCHHTFTASRASGGQARIVYAFTIQACLASATPNSHTRVFLTTRIATNQAIATINLGTRIGRTHPPDTTLTLIAFNV